MVFVALLVCMILCCISALASAIVTVRTYLKSSKKPDMDPTKWKFAKISIVWWSIGMITTYTIGCLLGVIAYFMNAHSMHLGSGYPFDSNSNKYTSSSITYDSPNVGRGRSKYHKKSAALYDRNNPEVYENNY